MIFDSTKSIIINMEGQSNAVGQGNWIDVSSTGLYAPYASLQSTTIDSKLLTREFLIPNLTWNSDRIGDFYEHTSGFMSHSLPDGDAINMGYSFLIDLMAYLNGLGYTKNVWFMNFALGGTSMREISGDFDWGTDLELNFESNEQLKEIIRFEQEVNGNDSQVINIWHQGEADQTFYATQQARLQSYYDSKKATLGYEPHLFMGQLVPTNTDRENMNSVFFDFAAANDNVNIVGQDLPGGVSTWEKMEADDPDGNILASDTTSYTYAGDNTHYNWPAQILQGRQLYDLVIEKYFT